MSPEFAARLAGRRIELVSEKREYLVLARERCVAFVHRSETGVALGSAGMMTDAGLAYLVWRGGEAVLASHGGAETPARPEQVEEIRQFSSDLKEALGP